MSRISTLPEFPYSELEIRFVTYLAAISTSGSSASGRRDRSVW